MDKVISEYREPFIMRSNVTGNPTPTHDWLIWKCSWVVKCSTSEKTNWLGCCFLVCLPEASCRLWNQTFHWVLCKNEIKNTVLRPMHILRNKIIKYRVTIKAVRFIETPRKAATNNFFILRIENTYNIYSSPRHNQLQENRSWKWLWMNDTIWSYNMKVNH